MLQAEKVLSDCKKAVELMDLETDPKVFRVLWVASLSLLRAVGHVLEKVDGKASSGMASLVATHYDYLKSQKGRMSIFWDFIEAERNILLKEYEVGFLAGDIPVSIGSENVSTVGDYLFCPMVSGPFEGMDCRDLINEAIEWWEVQLKWFNEHQP